MLCVATLGSSVAWADQAPPGYTYCAGENGRCNFQGTGDVAYGANGKFTYRQNQRDGVDCNNGVFGDPIYGTVKSCYVRVQYAEPPVSNNNQPPAGYTYCARENERCNFRGTGDVTYGANGKYAYRNGLRDGVDCNNGVFGDPIYGTVKSCYVRVQYAEPPVSNNNQPPAGYTYCARENERCNFRGMGDVAYGANGKYAYRNGLRDGVDCNNGVFGDPIYGTVKSCYVRTFGRRHHRQD